MFTVKVTEPAFSDVDHIISWLEERSLSGAKNWRTAFDIALGRIARNALSFGLAPESLDHDEDVHELTFSTRYGHTYRVVYIVRSETVYVVRVRGTGQPILPPDEITFPE